MIDDVLAVAVPGGERNATHLRRVASILASVCEPVMIYDVPVAGSQSRVVFVNAAFAALTGHPATHFIGRPPLALTAFAAPLDTPVRTSAYRHRSGAAIPLDVTRAPLEDDRGCASHVVAFCRPVVATDSAATLRARVRAAQKRNLSLKREIQDRKRIETKLLQATGHDSLTGLPNRLLFLERVASALSESKKLGKAISVLFLNCDRFKLVNDTFGHRTGDLLLTEVARRVKTCLQPADILARIGGDEFTILLEEGHERAIATNVAQRISTTFAAPFRLEGEDVYITASIGIVLSGAADESAEDLVRDADIAMFRAKELGKNRYEVFSNEFRDRLIRRRLLDTELRRALDVGQLSVAYQPIVALGDGALRGFEALVRWRHTDLGPISPEELIAVAEESGLIIEVGDWILRQACAQAQRWQAEFPQLGPLSMSVNVCVKQLLDDRFKRRVCNALMQSGLRAEQLRLEITESSLMTNMSAASALLAELQSIGVHSHIDDFGTGYSSLTYLQRFPVGALKIDRSFISTAGAGLANPTIVKTILSLAHNLGLEVIAEGVETAAQAAELRALGCPYAQGYLYAKPLASDMVAAYIATHERQANA